MFKKLAIFWGAIAALFGPTAAQAKEKVYTPTSKWTVDYGIDRCSAFRQFSYKDETLIMNITRAGATDSVHIALVGDLPNIRLPEEVDMRFLPSGDTFSSDLFSGTTDDGQRVAVMTSGVAPFKATLDNVSRFFLQGAVPRVKEDNLAAIDGLVIDPNRGDAMHFQTGPMGPLFKELDKCTATLAQYWGFDTEVLYNLSKKAEVVGSPAQWIRSSEYPAGFAAQSKAGVIDFRLTVDETGTVTQCEISNAMGGAKFSESVCKGVMERAKFMPALDKDGKPTRDLYINRVIFKIG